MRVASEVARLSADLVSFGNPSAITDVGTAALVASAAHGAARLNVLVNLNSVQDSSWASGLRTTLDQVPEPDRWNTDVQRQVQSAMERG
jgi:formiminotetrahydrofolate cyclodeaminase